MYSSDSMEKTPSWTPNVDQLSPACPRCGSLQTKFCYYNNYSLTQPRYFCKGCRRYWTKGGSLRNVPIGGGCRKTRRTKSVRPISTPSERSTKAATTNIAVASNNYYIDLAAVYANFLRRTDQTSDGTNNNPETIEQFPSSSHPHLPQCATANANSTTGFLDWRSSDFASASSFVENSDENILFACGNNEIYYQGLESIGEKHQLMTAAATGETFSGLNNPMNNNTIFPFGNLLPSGSELMLPDHVAYHSAQQINEPSSNNSQQLNGNIVNPFSPLNLEAMFRS